MLCATNKAVSVIRDDPEEGHEKSFTFSSYFYESRENVPKFERYVVDEISMVNIEWITKLYFLKRENPDKKFNFFGDFNQCPQVHERHYEYLNYPVFKWLCGYNMMKKQYVEKCARYDLKLFLFLKYLEDNKETAIYGCSKCEGFVKEKPLTDGFLEYTCNGCGNKSIRGEMDHSERDFYVVEYKPLNSKCQINICKTNKLKDSINEQFLTDKYKQRISWYVGMRVIGKENKKTSNMFNAVEYTIKDIEGETIQLEEIPTKNDKPLYLPMSAFEPAFCITTYRKQGDKITTKGNIRQVKYMNFNEFYTAVSRFTKFENVRGIIGGVKYERKCEPLEATPVKLQVGQVGEIYLLENDEGKKYVGKTTNTTEHRFQEHLSNPEDNLKKAGGDWSIECVLSKLFYFKETDLGFLEQRYINVYYRKYGEEVMVNKLLVKREKEDYKPNVPVQLKAGVERFKIEEGDGFFRIQKTINGEKINKRVRFNAKNKEQKFKSITEYQGFLIEKFGF